MADKYIYGNETDLTPDMAKAYGGQGYQYTNNASKLGLGSIVLGGAGALGGVADSGNATRLWGANRDETANAISQYASSLKNSSTQSQPQQQQPTVRDNSAQYKEMYDQSLAAARAALQASIQQSMGTFNKTIADAPGTFNLLENKASVTGAQNMQNLREMLANGGQQGGVNRTEETQVNTNTENQINGFEMQKQKVISDAKQAIADLQTQGNFKDAELVAQNAQDRIRALIDEANRVDTVGYARGRDIVTDTGYNNGVQTIAGKTADANIDNTKTNTELAKADLREKTDPNSVTNQMAKLGLQTAQLNYAYLPDQLKGQAQLILQQLAKGNIDIQTAQVQLNYLPQQLQTDIDAKRTEMEVARQNANTAAYSASKSGSSSSAKEEAAANANAIGARFTQEFNQGTAEQWLADNSDEIISNIGLDAYNKMIDRVDKNRTQLNANYTKAVNANAVASNKDYRTGGGGRTLM